MNFSNIIQLSLKGLLTHKTRSALTMLGIVIGIAAVIIIMSVGAGAQSLILDQINNVGSNLIGILPGAADEKGPPAAVFGITVTTLKDEDGQALLKNIPEIQAVTAYVQGVETISWQNQKEDATFIGTNASYTAVENTEVEQGRFFSPEEENTTSRLAVLGSAIAKDLFNDFEPLGQKIKIRREVFEVIGILKERGTVGFQSPDHQVFIPLSSAQKLLLGINHVNLIRVKANKGADIGFTVERVKEVLRDQHGIRNKKDDDFDVRNQQDAIAMLTTLTNSLKFFLAAIAAISLIVGGIGIMNIMFVAVTERTSEIGLRKAVGAKEKHLLNQFLIEATIITILGGVFGIIFGIIFSGLVAIVANYLGYSWKFIISPLAILLGLMVASTIGLFFGFFPAQKAAKLDPIDSLRYE